MSDQPEASAETLKQSLRNSVEHLSLPELSALIEFADNIRQQRRDAAREAFIAETRQKAAALGLTLDDLVSKSPRPGRPAKAKPAADKLPAKFRSPKGEEWSGRGRLPTWLAECEAKGEKREDYAV